MTTQMAPYQSAIEKSREKFIAAAGDLLRYEDESIFAMQAIGKTDYSISIANKNPQSVQLAMRNLAATGLTLNPAHSYAYLVPRDGSIVLDLSYKGLIKIATDCGAVLWARADVVYSADSFTYHGPAAMPEVMCDPFKKDRGEIIGAYCIAKTREGDILTEILPLEEIEKIRGKSDLYIKKKSGPWVEWFAQMAKKAVVKRASKTWPYTGKSGRLFEAIELANVSEGGYDLEPQHVGGNPKSGVIESLAPERVEQIEKMAVIVNEYLDGDPKDWDLKGAWDYIERQNLDGAEEMTALWSFLTSPRRSALKAAKQTFKHLEAVA